MARAHGRKQEEQAQGYAQRDILHKSGGNQACTESLSTMRPCSAAACLTLQISDSCAQRGYERVGITAGIQCVQAAIGFLKAKSRLLSSQEALHLSCCCLHCRNMFLKVSNIGTVIPVVVMVRIGDSCIQADNFLLEGMLCNAICLLLPDMCESLVETPEIAES